MVLYVAPNDVNVTRVGISVGKRVARQAVVRNRVRRRVSEAVRLRHTELCPGYDLVFIAREPCAEAPWQQVQAATEQLLRRARLLEHPRADGG